jgi:hypothetical protein
VFLPLSPPADISASPSTFHPNLFRLAVLNRPPLFTAEPTPYSLSTTTTEAPKQMLLNAVPLIMVGGYLAVTVIIAMVKILYNHQHLLQLLQEWCNFNISKDVVFVVPVAVDQVTPPLTEDQRFILSFNEGSIPVNSRATSCL